VTWDFRILGPIEVTGAGGAVKLGGPRQRAVLAILLLEANRVVPVDVIAEQLYGGDAPATAVSQVRDHVSQLRKALRTGANGDSVIETRGPGYMLRVDPDRVDATRFEQLVDEAAVALDRGDASAGSTLLREALALWNGPALADFQYDDFAQPTAARLEDLRLHAVERRIEADLALGRGERIVGEIEELVRAHPLREELRAHLMLALYQSGRQAEALDTYHEARRALQDSLGIGPSPALRERAATVLRQEPSLEPARNAETTFRNPYKGLRAFTEADSFDFYGREEIGTELLAMLEHDRFVAVVGPSGSGKSSVVLASLVPALRRHRTAIALLTPGDHPFEELETALLRVAVNPPGSLMEQLLADDRGLCRAVKRALPDDDSELIVIVDQLEELFTLVPDEQTHARFLAALGRAVVDPRCRCRAVVTLRADFYDRPLRHREFAELLRGRVLPLPPLSPDELERAISAPAAAVGVALEQGLLSEIVADVLDEPGALPLLQYSLTELFDRRAGTTLTREAYREIGGVSGALASKADELYGELSDDGKAAARQLFLYLVAPAEGEASTRRPVDLDDLDSLDVDHDALARCLDAFGASRLLTFARDARTGAPTVQIAHEALLSEWQLLRDWIDDSRASLRAQRRFAVRAAEWEESSRDPSFLLRGGELAQFEAATAESKLAQTERERDFLQSSVAARQAQLASERRAVTRLRALAGVLALAVLVAVAFAVYGFHQSAASNHQAKIATARRLAAASVANLDVDPQLSILLARRAAAEVSIGGAPVQEAVDALHRSIAASRVVLTIPTAASAAIAVSPDGMRIASAGSTGIVWNAKTGRRVLSLARTASAINAIAYSPNGSLLVTSEDDGDATVWSAATGRRLFDLPDRVGGYVGIAVSPNERTLATADGLGRVRLWSLRTRRLVRTIDAGEPSCDVAWNDDGTLVGAAQCGAFNLAPTSFVRVWNARNGRLVYRTGRPYANGQLQFAPNGSSLVAPTLTGTAAIWAVGRRRPVAVLSGHTGEVDAVAYSNDGHLVATGATDGTARVWDTRGRQLLELTGDTAPVLGVAFTPDGSRLVTTSADGTIRVWNITAGGSRDWLTIPADATGVATVAYSADGKRLVTSGICDGLTKLWNADTGALIKVLNTGALNRDCTFRVTGQRSPGFVATTGPGGRTSALAGDDGTLQVFGPTGQVLRTLPGGHQGVQSVTFDGTGKRIATGNWDGTAIVWDAVTGRPLSTFATHGGIVESVDFSPDGTELATGDEDTTTKLWDLRTGQQIGSLTGHTSALTDVKFSPDGTRLATSSDDGTVRVYVLPVDQLLRLSRTRLTRGWTRAECREYLPGGRCPSSP
jgi:WD40 repeat protein/DNA-binding SARP family transcriptional activator